MNLYLLTQNENDDYDTYDSCIVAAKTPEEAILIQPNGNSPTEWGGWYGTKGSWCSSPEHVQCTLIGHAMAGTVSGVILSSFNAG